MIFPFSRSNSFRDPFDPAARIDREVGERARRLIIGMSIEPDLKSICGALVVTEGKGKHLRVIRAISCAEPLPETTIQMLGCLSDSRELSLADLNAAQSDIALVQQTIVDRLKNDAGKYLDRLLLISLFDPGIWFQEGMETSYWPFAEPVRLAESTGISVIDAFPQRDLCAAGSGRGLFALPAWLLLADRSPCIANKHRFLIMVRDNIEIISLPASDGLDIEVPSIQSATCPGLSILRKFTGLEKLALLANANMNGSYDQQLNEILDWDQPSTVIEMNLADVTRTAVVGITERVADTIKDLSKNFRADEIIVDCPEPVLGTFVNQFDRLLEKTLVRTCQPNFGRPGHLSSVLTAVLGVMTIDQLPSNVPWITGASSQKILGRLSPGSASHWRQLLREMADFQPPAMRLRDAI